MATVGALRKRIDQMITAIEQQRKPRVLPELDFIMVYDQATGEPLPGYELTAENSHVLYKGVWLPKKVYLVPAGDNWLEQDGTEPCAILRSIATDEAKGDNWLEQDGTSHALRQLISAN